MKIWLQDPKRKRESVTLSLLVLGFCIASFKLIVSDMSIWGVTFAAFGGADFAMVMGALGGLYGFRKSKWSSDAPPPVEKSGASDES